MDGNTPTAKSLIQEEIRNLNLHANALSILLTKIDWDNMTPEEESHIWHYFMDKK